MPEGALEPPAFNVWRGSRFRDPRDQAQGPNVRSAARRTAGAVAWRIATWKPDRPSAVFSAAGMFTAEPSSHRKEE